MLRSAVEDLIIMCQRRLNDSIIILSDLFAAFKALLEIFLPRGFEYLHVTLFPSLELLQRDAKLRCIYLLRQAEPLAYGFDLRSLTPQQKQVIVSSGTSNSSASFSICSFG